jgi:hypothetical protein
LSVSFLPQRCPGSFRWLVVMSGVLLLLTGGCPIDSEALATDVFQAALDSITNSLGEALSTYLAGN